MDEVFTADFMIFQEVVEEGLYDLVVAVGGSAVGAPLLRKVIASLPEARRRVPDLRMVAIAGPRIDPASVAALGKRPPDGLEILPYVHGLYRLLAACDLAVVQGGLATALELVARRSPPRGAPVTPPNQRQKTCRETQMDCVRTILNRYRSIDRPVPLP